MYFNEVSDYLTELSLMGRKFKLIPKNGIVVTTPAIESIPERFVSSIDVPNYIDPNTGQPYNPFRENKERGLKLDKLRMQRSVLP